MIILPVAQRQAAELKRGPERGIKASNRNTMLKVLERAFGRILVPEIREFIAALQTEQRRPGCTQGIDIRQAMKDGTPMAAQATKPHQEWFWLGTQGAQPAVEVGCRSPGHRRLERALFQERFVTLTPVGVVQPFQRLDREIAPNRE